MTTKSLTVRFIADLVGGSVEGDETLEVHGIAAIDTAEPMELTYAVSEKHAAKLKASQAAAAITVAPVPGLSMTFICVPNVEEAMAKLLGHLAEPPDLPPAGIHPTALISPEAQLADDVAVGPYVTVGPRTQIAAGCVLCANVTIGADVTIGKNTIVDAGTVIQTRTVIGNGVTIGSNTVIGREGFGYYTVDGRHELFPHIGNVVIEDDVTIGSCACVDRAKFGSTRIGTGSKVDNHVLIAHNVKIGRGCLICGHSGLAGSCKLGDYVVLGGNTGVRDNITLGDRAQCSAFAAVASDVPDGQVVSGVPAKPIQQAFRAMQAFPKLPGLLTRVKKLEKRLDQLDAPEND